jgi:hypothetical protein
MPRKKGVRDLLLKFSAHDIGKYLKFAVRVSSKSSFRCYTIFIDDAKSAELIVFALIISGLHKKVNEHIRCVTSEDVRCKRESMESL